MKRHVEKHSVMTSDKSTWKTATGSFTSPHGRVPLDFWLPEFSDSKIITQDFQAYDVILGELFLNDLKIILNYDKEVMSWDGVEIDMKDLSSLTTSHQIYTLFKSSSEPESTVSALKRTTHILDAKYKKADLEKKNVVISMTSKKRPFYCNCSGMKHYSVAR